MKIIKIFIYSCIIPFLCYSQPNFFNNITLNVGSGYSYIYSTESNDKVMDGYSINASIITQPSKNQELNVKIGLSYSVQHLQGSIYILFSDYIASFVEGEKNIEAWQHQIGIPLTLNWQPKKYPFYIKGGFEIAYQFYGTSKEDIELFYLNTDDLFHKNAQTLDYTDNLNPFLLSGIIGFGYLFNIANTNWQIELNYLHGFTELYKSGARNTSFNYFITPNRKMKRLFFSIGYIFN